MVASAGALEDAARSSVHNQTQGKNSPPFQKENPYESQHTFSMRGS